MHAKFAVFATSALFAFQAFGQTPAPQNVDRVFRFAHAQTPPQYQELSNAIRAMTIIQQAVIDNEARSLTLGGTAGQIALAEWLFTELDKPANRPPDSATHEYRLPDRSDDVVRVFYLTHTPHSPRAMQEIVNAIHRFLTFNGWPFATRRERWQCEAPSAR